MSVAARKMGPTGPDEPTNPEKPIEGWKAIANDVELAIPTAWRLARRNRDPLPVWAYLHTVVAWRSALKEWRSRQLLPVPVADEIRGIGDEKRGTAENTIAPLSQKQARSVKNK